MSIRKIPVLKDKRRDFGIKSILKVLKYSKDGLAYFFRYERSGITYSIAVVLCVGIGIMLRLTPIEWIFIAFAFLVILATELLNTAIEAVCDLISPEDNPLVKIAKDCGSAASGVLSILGFIVVLVLYLPKIIKLVTGVFQQVP